VDSPGNKVLAYIKREVHLVNNLRTKILISNDIISPKTIIIDIAKRLAYIGSYNVTIDINSRQHSKYIRRRIYSKYTIVVLLYSEVIVPISALVNNLNLPNDRDFLFELSN